MTSGRWPSARVPEMVHAAESYDIDEVLSRLPETRTWVRSMMARVRPSLATPSNGRVLDLGSAQGGVILALRELGYESFGVEPWAEARRTAAELQERSGVRIPVEVGTAESIPFPDGMFDVVLANSVLEHVDSVELSLAEVCRVLRPGGVFWFSTASSLCPRQGEIRGFPLFGWYPLSLKRRIMAWALDHRPALVGNTTKPAMHWFTPRKIHRVLDAAGFIEVHDRWELFDTSVLSGPKAALVKAAKRFRPLRMLGDMVWPGCSYSARRR